MQKKPLPQYYNPEEVAESLGVTRRTVYEWLANGSLKAGRAGRRWVITPAQVEAFIAVRDSPPQAAPPQAAPVKAASPQAAPVYKTAAQLSAEALAEMDALADEYLPPMRPMAQKASKKPRRR